MWNYWLKDQILDPRRLLSRAEHLRHQLWCKRLLFRDFFPTVFFSNWCLQLEHLVVLTSRCCTYILDLEQPEEGMFWHLEGREGNVRILMFLVLKGHWLFITGLMWIESKFYLNEPHTCNYITNIDKYII